MLWMHRDRGSALHWGVLFWQAGTDTLASSYLPAEVLSSPQRCLKATQSVYSTADTALIRTHTHVHAQTACRNKWAKGRGIKDFLKKQLSQAKNQHWISCAVNGRLTLGCFCCSWSHYFKRQPFLRSIFSPASLIHPSPVWASTLWRTQQSLITSI